MKYIIGALVGLILLGTFIAFPVLYKNSSGTIKITVKEKDRITTGSGQAIQSKFVIYTANEVFENTDTFVFWKFDSADLQNSFEVGQTYTVEVAGWRVPFLSWFRNIVEVK